MAGEQRLWPLIVRAERCRNTSVPGIFVIRFNIEEEQEYTHPHTHTHIFYYISMFVAVFITADPGKNMKKRLEKCFENMIGIDPSNQQQMRPSIGQHSMDHGLHELLVSKKRLEITRLTRKYPTAAFSKI